MTLTMDQWAAKWGIPKAAMDDLRDQIAPEALKSVPEGPSEAAAQANIRLDLSNSRTAILWRNNIGAFEDKMGNWIRYGLMNDSKEINEKIKSSDLIGVWPTLIGPEHVGTRLGVFTAIEVKAPGFVRPTSKHEKAQAEFLHLVRSLGGYAAFSTGPGVFIP